MKKIIIAFIFITTLISMAIDVPQGATVQKTVVQTVTNDVSVVGIYYPRIIILASESTGKIRLIATRKTYLADGTTMLKNKMFTQEQIATLLGGTNQFQQVFGAIVGALQADVNANTN